MKKIKYIIILQCHIVKERCSGFFCENSFHTRTDAFKDYPKGENIRYISMTCGGCCGRATLRKLAHLLKKLKKNSEISRDEVALHFASCICKENFHGPKCPHYDYLIELVERKELKWHEGTKISDIAENRRDDEGRWSKEKK